MAGKQTLLDIARLQNPDGTPAKIIGLLEDANPIVQHMNWIVGNLDTGHQFTQRLVDRHGSYARFNEGVAISNTTEQQMRVDCARLIDYTEIDVDIAALGAGVAHNRASKVSGIVEGLGLTFADKLMYGNSSTNPAEFTGFANLLSDTSARNFIDGGGTGSDNTSVFGIDWGMDKVSGVVPKGTSAGMQHEDLGRHTIVDTVNETRRDVYRDRYVWHQGLAIENSNAAGRLANIDVSDLAGAGTDSYSGPDLVNLFIEFDETFRAGYNPVYYCSRTVLTALRKIANHKGNAQMMYEDFCGKKILHVNNRPIVTLDAIVGTEARVV